MHLQRIQVPDFRGLKDIDITFEKEFTPRIFPLGSQNGGGKSTLLQLIFTLIHCSIDPDKKTFLENMLNGFKIYDSCNKRVLAIIDIIIDNKIVKLEFFCYKDLYITALIGNKDDIKNTNLRFSAPTLLENFDKYYEDEEFPYSYEELELVSPLITEYLMAEKLIYIVNTYESETYQEDEVLLCRIDGIDMSEADSFLEQISQKIFLAAPASQLFLFVSKESRKLLFRKNNNEEKDYYAEVETAKYELTGFFTYDFLSVDILIDSFKAAGDRDFQEVIETGEYGNNYKTLRNDLNRILVNKKVNIDKDLAGVTFSLDKNGENVELYPEDLSHGELKRLSIYMWIKYRNIENAIVLIDEIEIAFHPDWQYQIISDLLEWSPSNQYILATHSYELCQAVTPSHVKEIEPKLIKKEA